VVGEAPGPDVRGRLFASNHVNGILDPILVFLTSGSDISPVAKSTLWDVPVLRWLLGVVDSVKIVRRTDDPTKLGGSNDRVFDEVAAWLAGGGNILIFPEGTSHNEPHLVELKTGAARMLRRACEVGSADGLTIQSIALEFDAREEARSRVLLIYGPVRRVADFDPTSEGFIERVTERVRQDLTERLVEGETWEERRVLGLAAEMLANDAGDRSLAAWSALGRELAAAKDTPAAAAASGLRPPAAAEASGLRPPAAAEASGPRPPAEALEAVRAYSATLDRLKITDAEVLGARNKGAAHTLYLLLTLLFAAVGLVAYALPRFVTNGIADRVKSKDETGTLRLGAALVFYPLWAVVLVSLALIFAPIPWGVALATLAVVAPFLSIGWVDEIPILQRRLRAIRAGAEIEDARRLREEATARLRVARQSRTGSRMAEG